MTLRIGEIDIALDADTSGLRKGLSELSRLANQLDKVAASRAKGARAEEAALSRQEHSTKKMLQNVNNLKQKLQIGGVAGSHIDKISDAFHRLSTAMASGRLTQTQYTRSLDDIDVHLGRANRALLAHKAAMDAKLQGDKATTASLARITAQENAIARAREATLNIIARAKAADNTGVAKAAVVNFAPFLSQMRSGILTTEQFGAAQRRLGAGLGELGRQLKAVPTEGFRKALQGLTSASVFAMGPLSGVGSRMQALSRLAGGTSVSMMAAVGGVTAMAAGLGFLTSGTIKTAIQMERVNAIMFSVTKSQGAATEAMRYATGIARKYGLDLQVVAKGYAQMTAAAQGTSLEGAKLNTIFEGLSKAAAATAMSTEQFEGAVLALQQMISKGKVQAEELRGQLGERLYGAFQKAAKAMGTTTSELSDMLRKGEVLAEDFLPKLAKVLNEDFAEGAIAASQTLAGRIGTLSTAFIQFKQEFDAVSGASQKFKTVLNGLINTLDWTRGNLRDVIAAVAGLGGAFIALNIGRIAMGFVTLVKWIGAATGAVTALNFAVAASPLGMFVRILGVAGAAVGGFAAAQMLAKKAMADTNDEQKRLIDLSKGYMDASAAQRTVMQDVRVEFTRGAAKQIKVIEEQIAAQQKQRKELEATRDALKAGTKVTDPDAMLYGVGGDASKELDNVNAKLKRNAQVQTDLILQAHQLRKELYKVATAPAQENPFVPPKEEEEDDKKKAKSIKDATRAYSDYANKVKDILDIQREMKNLNEGLNMFATGREDALDYAEALTKAENALAGLATSELQGISNVLESMGYSAETTAGALAKLYLAQDNINKQVDDTRNAAQEAAELAEERRELLQEVGREMEVLGRRTAAMSKGRDALEKFDRNQERADAVHDLNERLKEVMKSESERNAILQQYNMLLEQTEIEARRMETAQEWAQMISSTFQDLVWNISDAKFSLEDFFNNIHRMLTQKIVFEPFEKAIGDYIQNLLANRGGSSGSGGGGGFGGMIQGAFNAVSGFFGAGGSGSIFAGAGGFTNTMAIGQSAAGYANLAGWIPGLAEGGKLWSGVPTLVGEEGPELITSRRNGYVTPNDELGGQTITVNVPVMFNKPPTTPSEYQSAAQTAALVGQQVQKALTRNT